MVIMAAQKPCQGQVCHRLAQAEVEKERSTNKYNFQKLPKEEDKYRRLKHGARTILGKSAASPLNAP